MCEFTLDELRRLQRTLRRRFRVNEDENLVDIGFGIGLKRGRPHATRRFCVCFFVQRKRTPKESADRLPPEVTLRLRRGGRFESKTLPTDVVEVGRVVPTGRQVQYQQLGRRHQTTVGAVVAWRTEGNRRLEWGLVTVGHPFPPLETLSISDRVVMIYGGVTDFAGTLFAKSDRRPSFDSSIIRVTRDDLIRNQLMTRSQATSRKRARRLSDLQQDGHAKARTLRPDGWRSMRLHAYLPTFRLPSLGTLQHVISGLAEEEQTFQPGTSGSVWTVKRQAACIQVAGRPPSFTLGFGQALTSVLVWAEGAVEQRAALVTGSFRLVSVF